MRKTPRQIALGQVCECPQQCLGKVCQSSDSGLTAQKCWCADCADYRAEAKANFYKIYRINKDGTRTLEN